MMESVGAYEAKTHLPRLLARVAKGEQITITKRGIPIAMLVPAKRGIPIAVLVPAGLAKPTHKVDPAAVIEEFRRLRKEVGRLGAPVRQLIEKGRR